MESRQILLIGFEYPPDTGVGSVRISKFSKYLPQEWDIHVLTKPANANIRSGRDNVTVHQVPPIWSTAPKTFDQIRWAPKLVTAVQSLHKQYSFDCIWQTANPFLPLIAVPIYKRFTGTKIIVDLRDSWTLHPYSKLTTIFGRLYDKISEVMEPRVLQAADAVTVATDGMNRAYSDSYPQMGAKFHTVNNGYDRDDFPQVEADSTDGFDIVYAGKFSNFRDIEPFIRALSEVQSQHDVSFIHVGNPEKSVESIVNRYGLDQSYRCTGYVGRETVAQVIHKSDLGLAISGGSPQEMTTKIFDYMACETPILGCGPEGSMTDAISEFEYGYTVPNETDRIKSTLLKIIKQHPESLGTGPYQKYTREESAQTLARIIEETIG
ncbi:glycosyltransferase [Halosegnis rubeus]|uniref:Glycosyltransferase n=1 Tax=Halosegnis rubeus TaxID=2212850 RepID=A0A5N5U7P3_9EURY|nr:glycosyltransferase [Halosegnis rubeus]KAB7514666.1 glycosyltransferase [Halosegnis rubeus]